MRLDKLVPLLIIIVPTLALADSDKIRFRSGPGTLDQTGNLEIPVDSAACVANYVETNWHKDGYCCYASDHKQRFANALAQKGKTLAGLSFGGRSQTKFIVSPEKKHELLHTFGTYFVSAGVWDDQICLEFVSPNYGYGAVRWSKKPSHEILAGTKISVDIEYALSSAQDTEL